MIASKKRLSVIVAYCCFFLCSALLLPASGQVDQSSPLVLRHPADDSGFGLGLATGDVNGDGFTDVIVGSVLSTAGGLRNAGQVFVFFGGPSPSLTPNLVLQSPEPEAEARFGWGIAVGDVNGDGFDDIIVSALLANGGTNGRGKAYAFFGGPAIDAKSDVTFQSPSDLGPGAHFGWSIATGDINGDGVADVVIGAEGVRVTNADEAGEAFVYFGGRPFTGALSLTLRSPSVERGGSFGNAVAVADFNKDGFGDVAVAAPGQPVGRTDNAGQVFVFFGGPSFDTTVDLTLQSGSPRRTGRFGFALAAGDVNGDGFQDLIVGATNPPPGPLPGGPTNLGEVHIFSGGSPMPSTAAVVLDERSAQPAIAGFGSALATADVNRDGRSDIIVGVPTTNAQGATSAGKVLILYGGPNINSISNTVAIELQSPSPTTNELFGNTVAAGDFNGDHRPDVMVGAIHKSVIPPSGPGKVYIFLGR